ncbi:MAG: alkaline phosphatase family protein [Firmicutes bacterium]|nr:alkaline phosphatase family protein [Bacillota bacterium]
MRWYRTVLVGLLIFSLLAPTRAVGQESQKPPPRTERFILIVVDGLAAEAVTEATAPSINGLGVAGIRINDVAGVEPSTPVSVMASLLTGVTPARHGCTSPGDELRVPTLFTLLSRRETKTGFFAAGEQQAYGLARGASKIATAEDDETLTDKAIAYFREENPYFIVIMLRGPQAARAKGVGHDGYLQAVTGADTQIGRLFRCLHSSQSFGNTFICVSGTTGSPPLVFKAPELASGAVLPPAGIVDVAPTFANLMGVELPSPEGTVLWDGFAPGAEQSYTYLLELRVRDLSRALFNVRSGANKLIAEQAGIQREKRLVSRRQAEMDTILAARDKRILRLTRKVALLKTAILVLLCLSAAGFIYEYRLLKRRFLLFK